MNANELTFGIELETTMPANSTPVGAYHVGVQVPWLPMGWTGQRDGSIRARGGRIAVEFVSPVLKGADGLKQVIEVVKEIEARGGKVNDSCGLHIHVGFDRTDRVTLDKLVTLVANHEKAIFASTGTRKRETGHYCKRVQQYGNRESAQRVASNDRYHMLNLKSNRPTVEFRAFAGTLNVIKIVGYIRMCLGLVELAHNTKRVTKWIAKTPVASSPINRKGGAGQTEVCRLFYKLGWIKGRTDYVAGNVTTEEAPSFETIRKELMRLAKKYDTAVS